MHFQVKLEHECKKSDKDAMRFSCDECKKKLEDLKKEMQLVCFIIENKNSIKKTQVTKLERTNCLKSIIGK